MIIIDKKSLGQNAQKEERGSIFGRSGGMFGGGGSELSGALEATGKGAVEGLKVYPRAFGYMEPTEEEAAEYGALKERFPIASGVGEIAGETAPMLPIGFGIGGLGSKAARIGAETGLGALEGYIVSKGTGGDGTTGAALGGAIGLGAETVLPPVARGVVKGGKALGRGLMAELSEQSMAAAPHVVEPVRSKLGEAAFKEIWGGREATETQFKKLDRMADLRKKVNPERPLTKSGKKPKPTGWEKIMADVENIAADHADNPAAREITSLYEQTGMDLDTTQRLYQENLTKDADGNDIFSKIFDREMNRRGEQVQKGFEPYKGEGKSIQKSQSGNVANRKVGDEYIDADTSKGCIGNCPECYAMYGGATISKKCFLNPQPQKLTGHFSKDENSIRRIGTQGEPNMNPIAWRDSEKAKVFRDKLSKGEKVTQQELDELIDDTYDWSYTNEQLANTGLDTDGKMIGRKYKPGGKDMTFLISKFQTLKNFDPDIVKNVEVSIDPLTPSHFFKALKNVEAVKASGADTNFMLRIRSAATQSDEINALQKMAVDFANKHDIPVMETRVRFKKGDTAAMAQLQDEYYQGGGQYKHMSYFPSEQPHLAAGLKEGDLRVRTIEVNTPDGKAATNIWLQRPDAAYKGKNKHAQGKMGVWDVVEGGKVVQSGLTEDAAKDAGNALVQDRFKNIVPTDIKVREYSVDESPISQFGLKKNLHRQCNTFNYGTGACGKCQGCRTWLNDQMLRATKSLVPGTTIKVK